MCRPCCHARIRRFGLRQGDFRVHAQKRVVRVAAQAGQHARGQFHRADVFLLQKRRQLRHAQSVQIGHGLLNHFRHQEQTALYRRCAALVGFTLVGFAHHIVAQAQSHALCRAGGRATRQGFRPRAWRRSGGPWAPRQLVSTSRICSTMAKKSFKPSSMRWLGGGVKLTSGRVAPSAGYRWGQRHGEVT